MRIKTIFEWKDKEFFAAQKFDMTKRMAVACLEVEKVVKLSMGSGGPSAPGEPPHVQTGRLRASISSNWTGSGKQTGSVGAKADVEGVKNPGGKWPLIAGVVGTNVEYARALELGHVGMNLAARPYLRPAIDASIPALRKIFGIT